MYASGCLSSFVGRRQSVLRARFEVLSFASAGQVSVRGSFTASSRRDIKPALRPLPRGLADLTSRTPNPHCDSSPTSSTSSLGTLCHKTSSKLFCSLSPRPTSTKHHLDHAAQGGCGLDLVLLPVQPGAVQSRKHRNLSRAGMLQTPVLHLLSRGKSQRAPDPKALNRADSYTPICKIRQHTSGLEPRFRTDTSPCPSPAHTHFGRGSCTTWRMVRWSRGGRYSGRMSIHHMGPVFC